MITFATSLIKQKYVYFVVGVIVKYVDCRCYCKVCNIEPQLCEPGGRHIISSDDRGFR